ncbi:MAG TPA: serine hydrolase domain-containing protein, partial [Gaiella sp.]
MAGRETVGGAAADFADRLGELLTRHRVPGATLGILRDGEISAVGAGVLSTATGVDVTADSLFQIGSITKVWTATLVMQLVDE